MADTPDKTPQIERDNRGRFLKGSNANPAGRPKTTLYKTIERMTVDHADTIADKIVEMVEDGDVTVIGTLLRHSLPKGRLVRLEGMDSDNPAAVILSSVSSGQISSEEGAALAKIVELTQHEERLKAIEQTLETLK